MSDKEYQYQEGLKRGLQDKSERYGLLETDLLVSNEGKKARDRGYEAGQHARAVAEATAERIERTNASTGQADYQYRRRTDFYEGPPSLLFMAYPFMAFCAAGVAWLIALLATPRPSEPFTVAGYVFMAVFAFVYIYLAYGWFTNPKHGKKNREEFAELMLAFGILGLVLVVIFFVSR